MTTVSKNRTAIFTAIFLVVIGIALRVLRHYGWIDLPPNVAPVSAIAMFAAAYLPRRIAIAVPFSLMVLSDALIGWYTPGVVLSVYACFAFSLFLGWSMRDRTSAAQTLGRSLLGSIVFFLVTNAAVWALEGSYPNTLGGLLQSYEAGLPFFRNTVLGDLAYTTVFFGLYHAVVVYSRSLSSRMARINHG